MFNAHTKLKISTIACNEDMKGNAKCKKNSGFEPPFGDLEVTRRVHLWLDGKRNVNFPLMIIELFRYLSRLRHY